MTLRGLIPSLGAGGSLIAAAVCALAVFGGVLAFRGDDPGTADARSGDVVMPGGPEAGRAQTASVRRVDTPRARTSRGERAAVADRPRRAQARRRHTTTTRRSGDSPAGSPGPTAPGPSSGNRPAAPSSPPAMPPKPPKPPDVPAVPDVPDIPSGTVQRVVEQTTATVQPVVDAAPPPVKAPVQQVTNTVHDVAGTVDQTVDDLTGSLLP